MSLAADRPGTGAGSALLAWLRETAAEAGAGRLWLVTTDNNVCPQTGGAAAHALPLGK